MINREMLFGPTTSGIQLQSWITDVKHLALHYNDLTNQWTWYVHLAGFGNGIDFMHIFENLQNWLIFVYPREVQSVSQRRLKLVKNVLAEYEASNASSTKPNF
jgi:hypothetical protein